MVEDVVQKRIKVFKVYGFLAAVGLTCACLSPLNFGLILTPVSFIGLLVAYVFLLRSNIRGSLLGVIGCGLAVLVSLYNLGNMLLGFPIVFSALIMTLESVGLFMMVISMSKAKQLLHIRPIVGATGLVGLVYIAMLNIAIWMVEMMAALNCLEGDNAMRVMRVHGYCTPCFGVLIGVVFVASCLYRYKDAGLIERSNCSGDETWSCNWFSIEGRISRGDFWWRYVNLILVGSVVGGLVSFCISRVAPKDIGIIAKFIFDYFILGWSVALLTMPLRIRRLHDRGIAGMWVIIFDLAMFAPLFAYVFWSIGLEISTVLKLYGLMMVVGSITKLVEFVLLWMKGSVGENKYGSSIVNMEWKRHTINTIIVWASVLVVALFLLFVYSRIDAERKEALEEAEDLQARIEHVCHTLSKGVDYGAELNKSLVGLSKVVEEKMRYIPHMNRDSEANFYGLVKVVAEKRIAEVADVPNLTKDNRYYDEIKQMCDIWKDVETIESEVVAFSKSVSAFNQKWGGVKLDIEGTESAYDNARKVEGEFKLAKQELERSIVDFPMLRNAYIQNEEKKHENGRRKKMNKGNVLKMETGSVNFTILEEEFVNRINEVFKSVGKKSGIQ